MPEAMPSMLLAVISVCCIQQVCCPLTHTTNVTLQATVSTSPNPSSTTVNDEKIIGLPIGGFISLVIICGGFVLTLTSLLLTILFVYCKIPEPAGEAEYVYYKDHQKIEMNVEFDQNVFSIVHCWYKKNKSEKWEKIPNQSSQANDPGSESDNRGEDSHELNDVSARLLKPTYSPNKPESTKPTLTIQNLTHDAVGSYRCSLRNRRFNFLPFLQREKMIQLINLKIDNLSIKPSFYSVSVNWKYNEGIQSYKIRVQGGNEYTYNHHNVTETLHYEVPNLDPNTDYEIIVTPGKDGKYYSKCEQSIRTKTKDMTLNIVTKESFASALLNWERLDGIRKYKVTVDGKTYAVVGGRFEVPDLMPGQLYPVSVTPDYPGKDNKDHSSHINCRTKDLKIENLFTKPSFTSVWVNWKKIEGIQSYKIRLQGGNEYTYNADIATETLHYEVPNLDPNTDYEIIVTPGKDGKYFSKCEQSTRTKTKDMMLNIETEVLFTSVLLNWEQLDGIRQYKVTVDGTNTFAVVGGKFEVPDLKPGQLYHISVTPNCPGKDNKVHSSHINCKTKDLQIENLCTKSSFTSVWVNWKKIEGIQSYKISVQDGNEHIYKHDNENENPQYEVPALDPNTDYKIKVTPGKDETNFYSECGKSTNIKTKDDKELGYQQPYTFLTLNVTYWIIRFENASEEVKDLCIDQLTAEPSITTVVVKWKNIDGIRSYRIKVQGGNEYTYNQDNENPQYEVTKLDPNTDYEITVTPGNDSYYYSECGKSTRTQTKDMKLEVMKTELFTSVLLSWKPLHGISTYKVTVDGNEYSPDGARFEVPNLKPGQHYAISVTPHDSEKDYSKHLTDIHCKTKDLCIDQLTAEPSFTTVVVKWKKIDGIRSYRIKVQGGNEYTYNNDDSENPQYEVTKLDPNTDYEITVTPGNDSYYYSECGKLTRTQTKDMKLEVMKTELFTSVLLSWKPLHGISTYKVTVDGNEYSPDGARFEVPNLKPGQHYAISVTPHDSEKDYSKCSTDIHCKTKAVTMEGHYRSASLSWDPIEGVEKYRIYRGDKKPQIVGGKKIVVKDLEPGTKYTLGIAPEWPCEGAYARQKKEQQVKTEVRTEAKEAIRELKTVQKYLETIVAFPAFPEFMVDVDGDLWLEPHYTVKKARRPPGPPGKLAPDEKRNYEEAKEIDIEEVFSPSLPKDTNTKDTKSPGLFFIQAETGAGKTALSQHFVYKWAISNDFSSFVIHIPLRKVGKCDTLLEMINGCYEDLKLKESAYEELLSEMPGVIILDGLDEIEELSKDIREKVIQKMSMLGRREFEKLKVIITTRNYEEKIIALKAKPDIEIVLHGVRENAYIDFVSTFFKKDKQEYRDYVREQFQKFQHLHQETQLLNIPVYITLICIIFNSEFEKEKTLDLETLKILENKTSLFNKFLCTLLDRRQKNIDEQHQTSEWKPCEFENHPLDKGSTTLADDIKCCLRQLSALCFHAVVNDKYTFTRDDLHKHSEEEKLEKFIYELGLFHNKEKTSHVERRTGKSTLTGEIKSSVTFDIKHKLFIEYLAALHLADVEDNNPGMICVEKLEHSDKKDGNEGGSQQGGKGVSIQKDSNRMCGHLVAKLKKGETLGQCIQSLTNVVSFANCMSSGFFIRMLTEASKKCVLRGRPDKDTYLEPLVVKMHRECTGVHKEEDVDLINHAVGQYLCETPIEKDGCCGISNESLLLEHTEILMSSLCMGQVMQILQRLYNLKTNGGIELKQKLSKLEKRIDVKYQAENYEIEEVGYVLRALIRFVECKDVKSKINVSGGVLCDLGTLLSAFPEVNTIDLKNVKMIKYFNSQGVVSTGSDQASNPDPHPVTQMHIGMNMHDLLLTMSILHACTSLQDLHMIVPPQIRCIAYVLSELSQHCPALEKLWLGRSGSVKYDDTAEKHAGKVFRFDQLTKLQLSWCINLHHKQDYDEVTGLFNRLELPKLEYLDITSSNLNEYWGGVMSVVSEKFGGTVKELRLDGCDLEDGEQSLIDAVENKTIHPFTKLTKVWDTTYREMLQQGEFKTIFPNVNVWK